MSLFDFSGLLRKVLPLGVLSSLDVVSFVESLVKSCLMGDDNERLSSSVDRFDKGMWLGFVPLSELRRLSLTLREEE